MMPTDKIVEINRAGSIPNSLVVICTYEFIIVLLNFGKVWIEPVSNDIKMVYLYGDGREHTCTQTTLDFISGF